MGGEADFHIVLDLSFEIITCLGTIGQHDEGLYALRAQRVRRPGEPAQRLLYLIKNDPHGLTIKLERL